MNIDDFCPVPRKLLLGREGYTPQTYDKKFVDKKSWAKNHFFWDPKTSPHLRNDHGSLKK